MKRLLALALALALPVVSACAAGPPSRSEQSPGIVFPTTLGEGRGDGVDEAELAAAAKLLADAGAPDAAPPAESAPPANDAHPDPEPLRLAEQWAYELEWKDGALGVTSVTRRVYPSPVVTARRMGRYAIELWIGKELVDRVRFDVPLIGLEEPARPGPQPIAEPPRLGPGAHVRLEVLVPAAPRARRAVLVDRATSKITPLAWPPTATP